MKEVEVEVEVEVEGLSGSWKIDCIGGQPKGIFIPVTDVQRRKQGEKDITRNGCIGSNQRQRIGRGQRSGTGYAGRARGTPVCRGSDHQRLYRRSGVLQ